MLELKEVHDCQLPPMIVGYRTRQERPGGWPFLKKVDVTVTIYEVRDARWECAVCEAMWRWHPGYEDHVKGYWMNTYRPELWVKENEPMLLTD